jgi:hypothetical protein
MTEVILSEDEINFRKVVLEALVGMSENCPYLPLASHLELIAERKKVDKATQVKLEHISILPEPFVYRVMYTNYGDTPGIFPEFKFFASNSSKQIALDMANGLINNDEISNVMIQIGKKGGSSWDMVETKTTDKKAYAMEYADEVNE